MKLKITQSSVFNAKSEELEVGSIIEIEGDTIPAWLVNKAQQLDTDTGGGDDTGVTLDRDDLKKQADELGLEYARNISTEKLKELIDAKLAA
ncbi:hypothetical protein [Devosia sp. MC1541]|uniref:hypothetical protein n=1 Tax=Devosia sp. MC1541 TaxID=2725264 RepID=UPI00145E362F|nr:hypothetical protein [Devosia sp. MC1541]